MTGSGHMTGTPLDVPPPLTLSRARFSTGGPLYSLRVASGRIFAIAPEGDEVGTEAGERLLDLGGRTVLPGLWDAHVHATQWAGVRHRMDLSGFRSARETAAAVLHRMASQPAGEVLMGYGFRDGLWPDSADKAVLDAVCPDRPVALVSGDLHAVWLNSPCLALIGRADHPTGVLREHEGHEALAALPAVPESVLDGWVADACRAAAARGVTGFTDFQYGDNVADWRRRSLQEPLPVRVRAAVYPEYLDTAIDLGLITGAPVAGTGGKVEVGPLKLFTDGSLNTRTALCNVPYPGLEHTAEAYGIEETPYDELVRLMRHASAHGIEPAVHAIGDRANSIALDAFSAVRCRGRIEHAQLLVADDVPRFARLGVTVGVQPAHATDDRDVADRHWAGRTARAFAYADLLAAGARLEFGSDAPVSPLDPWIGIAAAVSRTADERPAWHPEQRIPLAAALAAAAQGKSLITVGDAADLAVLDADPARTDTATLRAMPVYATMLAGRWTHGPG
ncbi:amidohydrolase [Streptomyces sp. TS71-3]|uniref:amidohydrolase n=1 Tax=Streptomyces sp. TS71-3 TaxID=2733862 RepID=UPI001B19C774|nr:amidohydrolase family protein [Streptomyces sp. TS71-3]GHJ41209.1 amidohydrolase [Streptomyces sp. TS71-3]